MLRGQLLRGGSHRVSIAVIEADSRRRACLGKVSILLEGSPVVPAFTTYNDSLNRTVPVTYLENAYGKYFFNSTAFLDEINLGPKGRAYTGVSFSRVQAGNLCGNPEAKRVAAAAFGAFAVLAFLATVVLVTGARWRRRVRGSGLEVKEEQNYRRFKNLGLYFWGVILGVLPVVDLVTDFLVLSEVWSAWPMWAVLASICAPFVVAAYSVALFWVSSERSTTQLRGMRVKYMWPGPQLGRDQRPVVGGLGAHRRLLAFILLPVGLVGVLVQDVLAVAERFGVHLAWGEQVVVFEPYHDARVLSKLLLESLPQKVFQTSLYVLGSSRATRIYIDRQIFVQSIVVSLVSLMVQYCNLLWEAVYEGDSFLSVVMARLRSSGQPFVWGPVGEQVDDLKALEQAGWR